MIIKNVVKITKLPHARENPNINELVNNMAKYMVVFFILTDY